MRQRQRQRNSETVGGRQEMQQDRGSETAVGRQRQRQRDRMTGDAGVWRE